VSAHAIYQAVRLVEKELSFALSSESALNVLAAHTKRYAGNGYTLGTHNTLSSLLREARAVTETPDELAPLADLLSGAYPATPRSALCAVRGFARRRPRKRKKMAKDFKEMYHAVLPWVQAWRPLEPPLSEDPAAHAVHQLLKHVLHGKLGNNTTLKAAEELLNRFYGKPKEKPNNLLEEETLDLSKLSQEETETLISLLNKAKRDEVKA
jgi:hypothetical protein